MNTFQKRRVVSAEDWKPIHAAEAVKVGNTLRVTVVATAGTLFDGDTPIRQARRVARQNGFLKYVAETDVTVLGQGTFVKTFTFSK